MKRRVQSTTARIPAPTIWRVLGTGVSRGASIAPVARRAARAYPRRLVTGILHEQGPERDADEQHPEGGWEPERRVGLLLLIAVKGEREEQEAEEGDGCREETD